MSRPKLPEPPKHLDAAGASFWRDVQRQYAITDGPGLKLLQLLCEHLDVAERARAQLAAEGLTFTDRLGNVRAHPAAAIMRNAAVTVARLTRELNLDIEDGK